MQAVRQVGRQARPRGRMARCMALAAPAALATLCGPAAGAADALPAHPLLKGCDDPADAACVARLETLALQVHADSARRDGTSLWVTPGPGQAPVRLDDDDGGGWRYLGPLAGTGLQLVQQTAADQAPRYRLLGPGVASGQRLDAPPWPSPDGRLLAVAALPHDAQAGSLALWSRVGSQWRLLYRLEPAPGLGFAVKAWRADGAALRLAWRCEGGSGRSGRSGRSGNTQLRDGPYGWDLVPPPPDHCR